MPDSRGALYFIDACFNGCFVFNMFVTGGGCVLFHMSDSSCLCDGKLNNLVNLETNEQRGLQDRPNKT